MKNDNVLAAIDIGSNAVRLLVCVLHHLPDGSTSLQKESYLRVPIRLGEDVFTTGRIGAEKEALLLDSMQGFAHIMRAYQVKSFRACATSAMRDAENGKDITDSVMKLAGIPVEIINGYEEADLIYQAGSFAEMTHRRENCLFVDVGGGSTEITLFGDAKKEGSYSFQIGTVRLLNKAVKDGERERLHDELRDVCRQYGPQSMIASGGNINKVYKLLNKKKGEPIASSELAELYASLSGLSVEERIEAYNLNYYRADVIVPALSIFCDVVEQCPGMRDIYVPKIGLVDGLIHSLRDCDAAKTWA